MESMLIKISDRVIVDIKRVAGFSWEGERAYVYLEGGRFLALTAPDAGRFWEVLKGQAVEWCSCVNADVVARLSNQPAAPQEDSVGKPTCPPEGRTEPGHAGGRAG